MGHDCGLLQKQLPLTATFSITAHPYGANLQLLILKSTKLSVSSLMGLSKEIIICS
jgi:hypothetical protein